MHAVNNLQSYNAQSPCQRNMISPTEKTCLKCLICSPAIVSVTWLHHHVTQLHNASNKGSSKAWKSLSLCLEKAVFVTLRAKHHYMVFQRKIEESMAQIYI